MKTEKYLGINIDYSRDDLLEDFGKQLLKEKYLRGTETSPQQAFARAAVAYCAGDMALAQRIYDYASNHWFSFATPVLSNAPFPDQPPKGLPISCFASFVDDTLHSLIDHTTEVRWLSVKGGGVGGHWSSIRAMSTKAPSPVPFLKTMDADMGAYKQGVTRRGSYAAYLDVSHPDIIEFLKIRIPTGDLHRKCLNTGFHHAINITDNFMEAVRDDKSWDLICPHNKDVRDTVRARELWEEIVETRNRTGEPYLCFIDTANAALPEAQKKLGLKIRGSNLCAEIMLPTDVDRTFVCCLSSINAEKYDAWKNTMIVEDLVRFLDNVLQFFIDNAPPEFEKSIKAAKQERSLGLGLLGFHSLLQQRGIAFEDHAAKELSIELSKHIKERAHDESVLLGMERGFYQDYVDADMPDDPDKPATRNAHLIAYAPNANSSITIGTSASIEPIPSNVYVHKTRIGSHLVKNKYLEKYLVNYATDKFSTSEALPEAVDEAVEDWVENQWLDINLHDGSVQHLDYMDDVNKKVFKTAMEISQLRIIELAAARQPYICQGQSLNLFFPAGTDREDMSYVHYTAWKGGLKSLYYLRTKSPKRGDAIGSKVERVALSSHIVNGVEDDDDGECDSCSG